MSSVALITYGRDRIGEGISGRMVKPVIILILSAVKRSFLNFQSQTRSSPTPSSCPTRCATNLSWCDRLVAANIAKPAAQCNIAAESFLNIIGEHVPENLLSAALPVCEQGG
jgi:hypothetical protein